MNLPFTFVQPGPSGQGGTPPIHIFDDDEVGVDKDDG